MLVGKTQSHQTEEMNTKIIVVTVIIIKDTDSLEKLIGLPTQTLGASGEIVAVNPQLSDLENLTIRNRRSQTGYLRMSGTADAKKGYA
jgi:hypothetical protein